MQWKNRSAEYGLIYLLYRVLQDVHPIPVTYSGDDLGSGYLGVCW